MPCRCRTNLLSHSGSPWSNDVSAPFSALRDVSRGSSAPQTWLFKKNYRPLVSLAASAGVGRRRAVPLAEAAGLELITGPSVDGGRQYFVRVCASTKDAPLHANVGMGNPLVPLALLRHGR